MRVSAFRLSPLLQMGYGSFQRAPLPKIPMQLMGTGRAFSTAAPSLSEVIKNQYASVWNRLFPVEKPTTEPPLPPKIIENLSDLLSKQKPGERLPEESFLPCLLKDPKQTIENTPSFLLTWSFKSSLSNPSDEIIEALLTEEPKEAIDLFFQLHSQVRFNISGLSKAFKTLLDIAPEKAEEFLSNLVVRSELMYNERLIGGSLEKYLLMDPIKALENKDYFFIGSFSKELQKDHLRAMKLLQDVVFEKGPKEGIDLFFDEINRLVRFDHKTLAKCFRSLLKENKKAAKLFLEHLKRFDNPFMLSQEEWNMFSEAPKADLSAKELIALLKSPSHPNSAIKKLYLSWVLKNHPDKAGKDSTEEFQLVNAAYQAYQESLA